MTLSDRGPAADPDAAADAAADAEFFAEVLRYVRWSPADEEALRALEPHVAPERSAIVEEFYERVREHPAAERVLRDEAQVRRLHRSLERWLEQLLSQARDLNYFRERRRIGAAHARVGLPQRYVFTAMALIRSRLDQAAAAAFGADRGAEARSREALGKALDVELAIVAEVFHGETLARVERARRREADGRARRAAVDARDREGVEQAEAMVVVLDGEGRAALRNRKAEEVTGYARDEVEGPGLLRLLVGDAAARARLLGARPGEPVVLEAPLVTRSGRELWVRWCASAAVGAEGRAPVRYLIGVDLTEARRAEERARRAERLAAVGTLAAGLAHEIRNPLNAASLHLSLIERSSRRGDGAPEVVRESVGFVREELDRLSRLLADFLDVARPQPPVLHEVDLAELVQRAVNLLRPDAEAGGVELAYEGPARPLRVRADVERMRQVLLNLMRNAFDAVAGRSPRRVIVRARPAGRFAEIDVEDNGPGFPPDAPVFDAFYTTKPAGTGLGLAVVHRLVDAHEGSITVRSAPGCTLFTVRLPREVHAPASP